MAVLRRGDDAEGVLLPLIISTLSIACLPYHPLSLPGSWRVPGG